MPSGAYSQFVVSHCTRGESCRSAAIAAAAPPVVLAKKPVPRLP